jgi:predicted nucleic acid-binding protein
LRVFFDTNVVLDLLLDREPFSLDAARSLSMVESGRIEGWLCATTVTTLHYLIRKSVGARNALDSISLLLSLFEIAPVSKTVLEGALRLRFNNFEDAVLHEAARYSNADVIVTRNTSDFKNSSVPVQLPGDLQQG